jgi:hypothetical protein
MVKIGFFIHPEDSQRNKNECIMKPANCSERLLLFHADIFGRHRDIYRRRFAVVNSVQQVSVITTYFHLSGTPARA